MAKGIGGSFLFHEVLFEPGLEILKDMCRVFPEQEDKAQLRRRSGPLESLRT